MIGQADPARHDLHLVLDEIRARRAEMPFRKKPRIQVGATDDLTGPLKAQPIYVVPIFDLSERQVVRLLRQLYRAHSVRDNFRLVVFTSQDVFRMVRPFSWPVEFVLSESSWTSGKYPGTWTEHVVSSLAWVVDRYGARGLILADPQGSVALDLASQHLAEASLVEEHSDEEIDADAPEFPSWRAWSVGGTEVPEGPSVVRPDGHEFRVDCRPTGDQVAVAVVAGEEGLAGGLQAFVEAAESRRWTSIVATRRAGAGNADVLAAASTSSMLPVGAVRVLAGSHPNDPHWSMAHRADFLVCRDGGEGLMMAASPELPTRAAAPQWWRGSAEEICAAVESYARRCADRGIVRSNYPT